MGLIRREQLAGMNCHYTRYSLDYFFEAQARAGFVSVALWGGSPHFRVDDLGHGDCARIRRKARDCGLRLTSFTTAACSYLYQYCAPKPEAFARSLAYFENGARAAGELEIPLMVCSSGWGFWNEDREEAWKRSREMLSRVAQTAQSCGVTLTMESLRRPESQLVYTLADAKRMWEEVAHPNFKLMVDTTAMAVAGETLDDWFSLLGPEIQNTHFIDGTPYGHLAWGDGTRDLKADLQSLARHGYTGQLGLEVTDGRYLDDPYAADRKNMSAFAPFLSD